MHMFDNPSYGGNDNIKCNSRSLPVTEQHESEHIYSELDDGGYSKPL